MDSNKIKLRVVFMGTSDLSEIILKSLIQNEYNIVGVFTKPDALIGRKQETSEPLVKKIAKENSIEVFQPTKFNSEAVEILRNLKPDIVVVAAYGKIIPKSALEIPGFGCLNVHVSILPKYRGPSPIQNTLLNGETETGVTIMLMDQGVDTGDILTQETTPIGAKETTGDLMEKMAHAGAALLLKTLPLWIEGKIEKVAQDSSRATFCQLIEREDGKIFWTLKAEDIYNRYRALMPWPGIFTYWKNGNSFVRLKLLSIDFQKTNPVETHQQGEVFELGDDIGVQTSDGVILLNEIQSEGKKSVTAKSFVNGHKDFIGSILQ